MSALDDLKTRIDEAIYQNTQQKITGEVLQDTLEDMVDTMGVSVSQNNQTGHTEIHIGSNDYPVASIEEVSQLDFKGGFVTASNYQSFFTDANNAIVNRAYLINGDITGQMVANLPQYGTRGVLVTFSGFQNSGSPANVGSSQLYFIGNDVYGRVQNNEWQSWQNLAKPNALAYFIGGGGFVTDGSVFNNADNAPIDRVFLIQSGITPSQIANLPEYSETTRAQLITLSYTNSGDTSQGKIQLFFNPNRAYFRYNSNGAWGRWLPISKDQYAVSGGGFITSDNYQSYFTDANNVIESRIYLVNNDVTNAMISNLPFYGGDRPHRLVNLCWQYTPQSGGGYQIQLFVNSAGQMWYRINLYSNNTTSWTQWFLVNNSPDDLTTIVNKPYSFSGKTFKFFGDSIVVGSQVGEANTYKALFCAKVGATYNSYAIGGASYIKDNIVAPTRSQVLEQLQGTTLDSDFLYIAAGINDSGLWQQYSLSDFESAVKTTFQYITDHFTGTAVFIVTPINASDSRPAHLNLYRKIIQEQAIWFGFNIIDGSKFGFPYSINTMSQILREHYYADTIHPNIFGHQLYFKNLCNAIL